MELIDYAERQGMENYAWHEEANATTRHEANLTLGFLLAAGAASFGWGIAGSGPGGGLVLLCLCGWFFALAAAVQLQCLRFRPLLAPANQPLHVYLPEYDTLGIREQQLAILEEAILLAIEEGNAKARRLFRIRLAACCSPLAYLIFWAACRAFGV